MFNLSALYNTTADHFLTAGGYQFVMNVCGPLVSVCNRFDRTTVCLEGESESLTYEDGSLVLDHNTNRQDEVESFLGRFFKSGRQHLDLIFYCSGSDPI
jgi:hypothetical protein